MVAVGFPASTQPTEGTFTRKLGNLNPQLLDRINTLQLDRIESLGEALLDFNSIADLQNWLSQN